MLHRLLSGSPHYTDHTFNGDAPAVATPVSAADLTDLMDRLKRAAVTAEGDAVDYGALAATLQTARQDLYAGLRALDLDTLTHRGQSLAFWINLYNILVLDAVLAFRVSRSVIAPSQGLFRFFARAAYLVGGHRFSADDIEHGVLRQNQGHPLSRQAQFPEGDPRLSQVLQPMDVRIHFALNCASQSCPPIRVYEQSRLSVQLDLATRSFIDAETHVDPAAQTLEVSSLFKWYRADFADAGGIAQFTARYLDAADPRRLWLQDHIAEARIRYRKYHWGLNSG